MASFSLRQAAEAAGTSKSTIFRAIKSGRLSAGRTDDGEFAIDPAELFRVYPPKTEAAVPLAHFDATSTGHDATLNATHEVALNLAVAETEVRLLREIVEQMKAEREQLRSDRDNWQRQAASITRALPAPAPAASRGGGFAWLKRMAG